LIELAARANPSLRHTIFEELKGKVDRIVGDKPVVGKLEGAIFIRPDQAPSDWTTEVVAMLQALFLASQKLDDRLHWEQLANRLSNAYPVG
jgi:hypothetical protein